MRRRIGGEMQLQGRNGLAAVKKQVLRVPKAHHLWLDTGRSALTVILREILKRGGRREAWLPAYCCESAVAPFHALGFRVNFYSMGPGLQSLPLLPGKKGATFLYIHYFGMKTKRISNWIRQSKIKDSFFVIEDCVQASLNENVGNEGHFSFTSYRKFLPQPDGALLNSDMPLDFLLQAPDKRFISGKLTGKLLRGRNGDERIYLKMFEEAECLLKYSPPRRMSRLSVALMACADLGNARLARRRNWRFLSDLLRKNGLGRKVKPLYPRLNNGDVPLGFPVMVSGALRDRLRAYLAQKRIFCPVHWPLPHLSKKRRWAAEHHLSRNILTLPIDQYLGKASLRYMASCIAQFFKEVR